MREEQDSEAMEQRLCLYFNALIDNYANIFWEKMDISRDEADSMLGVERVAGGDGSGEIVVSMPKWPIS